VWEVDAVEFFIAPGRDTPTRYLEIGVSAGGGKLLERV